MLPLIRADFSVTRAYGYTGGPPLGCPLTVFCGLRDKEVDRESPALWGDYTTARFSTHMQPGDQFFLHSSRNALLEIVARELGGAAAGLS